MDQETITTEAPGIDSGADTSAGITTEAELANSFLERVEEQPEANNRSAGNELDSAVCNNEPSAKWRSLKITDHAIVVGKAMIGLHSVVGGGTIRRYGAVSGET